MRTTLLTFSLAVLLSGCGPVPLVPVTYDEEPVVASGFEAQVSMNTGIVTGHGRTTVVPAGGVFVPVNSGPAPNLHFGEADQEIFTQSLRDELVRTGIIGSLGDETSELQIVVNFVHTEHFPNYQEYKLTASMVISFEDYAFGNAYEVLSSEGDSFWTKMNTNAANGKKKAAEKLLKLLIDDIQGFIQQVVESMKLEDTEPELAT